jgi:hypothetical protein
VNKDNRIAHVWDAELSNREVLLIGKVIVQWGALEHEIFTQTLLTFDAPEGEQITLPRVMDNLRVTELLALWKQRVVDQAHGPRARVLQLQLDEILQLKELRDAIVHGTWDWSPSDLSRVSTVRVRKKDVITTHFTADDLANFYGRLARINFNVRFPGGLEELARQRAESGSYISRRGLSILSGDRLADDWLPMRPPQPKGEGEK